MSGKGLLILMLGLTLLGLLYELLGAEHDYTPYITVRYDTFNGYSCRCELDGETWACRWDGFSQCHWKDRPSANPHH